MRQKSGPAKRRLIEDVIESLILLLDGIDGDDDLEDDDRELDPTESGKEGSDGLQKQFRPKHSAAGAKDNATI